MFARKACCRMSALRRRVASRSAARDAAAMDRTKPRQPIIHTVRTGRRDASSNPLPSAHTDKMKSIRRDKRGTSVPQLWRPVLVRAAGRSRRLRGVQLPPPAAFRVGQPVLPRPTRAFWLSRSTPRLRRLGQTKRAHEARAALAGGSSTRASQPSRRLVAPTRIVATSDRVARPWTHRPTKRRMASGVGMRGWPSCRDRRAVHAEVRGGHFLSSAGLHIRSGAL